MPGIAGGGACLFDESLRMLRHDMKALIVTVSLSLSLFTGTAQAEEGATDDEKTWYGWQIMANDAAGLALAYGALATDGRTATGVMFTGTVVAWSLGGPVIHLAHGNNSGALKSLGSA